MARTGSDKSTAKTTLTRRAFGAGIAAGLALPAFAANLPSLGALAAARGTGFGSAFSGDRNPAYRALLSQQCRILTPENGLKAEYVAPDPVTRHLDTADDIYAFCARHNLAFHGHTLYWHATPLRWITAQTPDAIAAYTGYAAEIMRRYPDTASWDVVNEVVEEATAIRPDYLTGAFGLDFIDAMFRTAQRTSPAARRVINDYNLSCTGHWCTDKRANMLDVLDRLLERGTPVDVVGIQAHLSSRYLPDADKTLRFIEAIEARGLEVYLAEMDVNDVDFRGGPAKRDQAAAAMLAGFVSEALKSPAVTRVMFWGLSDYDNWLVRGDGGMDHHAAPRPGLFDRDNQPKDAFWALVEVFENAPDRSAMLSPRAAQKALADAGFDPGPLDGKWGRKSQSALQAWQKANGLALTEGLDAQSMKMLSVHGK